MSSRPTLEKVYVCEKETNNYVQVKSFGCVVEHLRRGKKAEWKGKKGEEEKVTPEMTEEEKEGLRGEEGEERKLGWEERETVEVDLGENGEGGFFLSLANSASPSSSSSPSPSFKTEKSIPLCHSPICPMRGCDERAIVPLASTQKKIKVFFFFFFILVLFLFLFSFFSFFFSLFSFLFSLFSFLSLPLIPF